MGRRKEEVKNAAQCTNGAWAIGALECMAFGPTAQSILTAADSVDVASEHGITSLLITADSAATPQCDRITTVANLGCKKMLGRSGVDGTLFGYNDRCDHGTPPSHSPQPELGADDFPLHWVANTPVVKAPSGSGHENRPMLRGQVYGRSSPTLSDAYVAGTQGSCTISEQNLAAWISERQRSGIAMRGKQDRGWVGAANDRIRVDGIITAVAIAIGNEPTAALHHQVTAPMVSIEPNHTAHIHFAFQP